MSFQWLVGNPDEGILRREGSLNDARGWVKGYSEGRLHLSYAYRSRLIFDYSVISPGETGSWSVCILRADAAQAFGFSWAFELPDQFPYPTQPYRHGVLSDDERAELQAHIEKELSR